MKYQIQYKEDKMWNGKPFVEATLISDDGEEVRVSAWNNEFAGNVFEGELEKNDKGYWRIKKQASRKPNFDNVMKKKEESIGKFQDNKELSIKLASTLRMAVDLTIAMTPEQRETTMEETIKKWRAWLWSEWDKEDKDFNAF